MSNKIKHWKKTKSHTIITLLIWLFFSIIIFMFGHDLNSNTFLGYPLAYYMSAQGSLLAFVILLFWFANRQEAIDKEFGFQEKGEED